MGRLPVHDQLTPADPGSTVKLVFCGDIMVMQRDIVPRLHPDLCELIASADLFIGNCEAPVGTHAIDSQARYRFCFHMPRAFLQGIVEQTGLPTERWLLSTANNHAGDKGYQAYLDSLSILADMGIRSLGRWQPDAAPVTAVRCQELTLGLAAWTQWLNYQIFPADDRGIHHADDIGRVPWDQVKRENGLDLLIGIPHWEFEFQHFPRPATRAHARRLIDEQGFDLIVGAHPHTLQPMERFECGLCQYSLGNFCGLGNAWPVKLISLLEVHVSQAPGTRGRISGYRLHPFVQVHEDHGVSLVPLDKAPDRLRPRLEERLGLTFARA